MRRRADFVQTTRLGRRLGGRLLVVHAFTPAAPEPGEPVLVGLVVSRAVGGAVVRNRVSRRLRHIIVDRLASLPGGARLVLRVLPPAAVASSEQLAGAIDRLLGGLTGATAA